MDHPGNPLHEGTGTAARGVAELMAVLVMVIQIHRQSQEAIKFSQAQRDAQAVAMRDRERARDARQWSLALDKGWMRGAETDEVIQVWALATRWTHEDVQALRARRLAEARLDQLNPGLMHRYRDLLAAAGGQDPARAMWEARQLPQPIPVAQDMPPEAAVPVAPRAALAPAPDAWQAGPIDAKALPRATPLAIGPPAAIDMGAAGWTDAARKIRQEGTDDGRSSPEEGAMNTGVADPDASQSSTSGVSTRERLAAAMGSEPEGSGASRQADIDRGTHEVRPCGTPRGGEPISRPLVAGPGAGLAAVRTRGR